MTSPTDCEQTMPHQPLTLWTSLDPAYTGPSLVSFSTPPGQTFDDLTFVDAAAAATGLSPAAIRRSLRIAEGIIPQLLAVLKDAATPVPEDVLLRIADMDELDQAELLLQLPDPQDRPFTIAALLEGSAAVADPSSNQGPLTHAWQEASDAERREFRKWLAEPEPQT